MSEWISVKDSFPPKDKDDKDWSVPVLYCYYDNKEWWTYHGVYCFKDKHWYGDNSGIQNHTTHWMPLPNPPMKASEE